MKRYMIRRVAHCNEGHGKVLDMTENCPQINCSLKGFFILRAPPNEEDIMFMNPKSKYLLLFLFFLLLLYVATADYDKGTEDSLEQMGVSRIEGNIDAPHFILPDLEERKRSLSEFKGKFVMLNFWATW